MGFRYQFVQLKRKEVIMYRGKTFFKCTECGHLFVAPDIELGATTLSIPQRCPKCESLRTRPANILGGLGLNKKYEGIWEKMEKE